MANAFETIFTKIANAIRNKDGTTTVMTPAQMPDRIAAIPSGGNDTFAEYLNNQSNIGAYFARRSGGWTGSSNDISNETLASILSTPSVTSKVTNMSHMFYTCDHLTTIPAMDTSNVTSMSYMFGNCYVLATIPAMNTSNVTTMDRMFYSCYKLTSIPEMDASNVTDFTYTFYACRAVTAIHMKNFKVSFDISTCTNLVDHDALLEILNNLATVTTSPTLTMNSTQKAALSEDELAIATNKGWTIK